MFAPRLPTILPGWARLASLEGKAASASRETINHLALMNHKILIVDDDEAVRTGLSGVLLSEGYEVSTASNGREAVERFQGLDISLILVDINMPVLNGWGAIGQLRSLKPKVPIILITARPDQRRVARAAGVELMEKPLEIPHLLARISKLLQRPADT
jgi:DNA-binding response OmpR family regulator